MKNCLFHGGLGASFACWCGVEFITNTHFRKSENDVDSYPPSAINEKVGYAQYGNGFGDGGGGGGISGYRPSGKYEKQIIPDSRSDYRQEPMKRDPILWSNASASHQRFVLWCKIGS